MRRVGNFSAEAGTRAMRISHLRVLQRLTLRPHFSGTPHTLNPKQFLIPNTKWGELIHQKGLIGSIAMGSGIATMHHIGMAAMRVPARILYDPNIVVLSIVLAIAISLVALVLAFRVVASNLSEFP